MDYDCFLKLIGYNISDTKRKNLIFDSVNKTERPISERCMKALSSIFLLELDLLRFTEVHKARFNFTLLLKSIYLINICLAPSGKSCEQL